MARESALGFADVGGRRPVGQQGQDHVAGFAVHVGGQTPRTAEGATQRVAFDVPDLGPVVGRGRPLRDGLAVEDAPPGTGQAGRPPPARIALAQMRSVADSLSQLLVDEPVDRPMAGPHCGMAEVPFQPARDLPGRMIFPQPPVHLGPQPRVVQLSPAPPARDFRRPGVGGHRLIRARIAGQFPPDRRGGPPQNPGRRFHPLARLHVNHDDGALF